MHDDGYEFVPLVDERNAAAVSHQGRADNWRRHVSERILEIVTKHSPEGPTRDKQVRCQSRLVDDTEIVECTVIGNHVRLDTRMLGAVTAAFPGARFSHNADRDLVFRVGPRERRTWLACFILVNAVFLVGITLFKKQ